MKVAYPLRVYREPDYQEQLVVGANTQAFVKVGDWSFDAQVGENGDLCLTVNKPGDDERCVDINVDRNLQVIHQS